MNPNIIDWAHGCDKKRSALFITPAVHFRHHHLTIFHCNIQMDHAGILVSQCVGAAMAAGFLSMDGLGGLRGW